MDTRVVSPQTCIHNTTYHFRRWQILEFEEHWRKLTKLMFRITIYMIFFLFFFLSIHIFTHIKETSIDKNTKTYKTRVTERIDLPHLRWYLACQSLWKTGKLEAVCINANMSHSERKGTILTFSLVLVY